MSEILSHLPVTDLVPPGRHGRPGGEPGVIAHPVPRLALATLAARRGAVAEVTERAMGTFGLSLVDGPKVSFSGDVSFVGIGPGRWLVSATQPQDNHLARLQETFGPLASLTDQSDANLVLDLYGPDIRAALAKLVPLDLDPGVFGPADAAATMVALISLTFWQLNDLPAYRVCVPRSFAPAFLRALAGAAAEFGFEMADTLRG